MDRAVAEVSEVPTDVEGFGSVFSIADSRGERYTHSFFKYPCKFIPEIPRWGIRRCLSEPGGIVLDPFCGSGTTLVEATVAGKEALGIDFDPFSRLLSRVKSTPLSESQTRKLKSEVRDIIRSSDGVVEAQAPDIPNMDLWFSKKAVEDLSRLWSAIESYSESADDKDIRDFLVVCFAGIVRKVSNADNQSPKPYVSRRVTKTPAEVMPEFLRVTERNLDGMEEFRRVADGRRGKIVGEDARSLNEDGTIGENVSEVDFAITSPPYINAFDYVRSLKLENLWLRLYNPTEINLLKSLQIGTESIPSTTYSEDVPPSSGVSELDDVVSQIYEVDKLRGYVVSKFFGDMKTNLEQVHSVLKDEGSYCLVVGANRVRSVPVPTHHFLCSIAEDMGFSTETVFSYVIKNPYLRFPRKGRGGLIGRDHVILLKKTG